MKARLVWALGALACALSAHAQNVINLGSPSYDPGVYQVIPAITANLGSQPSTLYADYTLETLSGCNVLAIQDAQNSSATDIYSIASGLLVTPHTPYHILASETTSYGATSLYEDSCYYSQLMSASPQQIVVEAMGSVQPAGGGNGRRPAWPAASQPGTAMTYVSSPNSLDGSSADGIDFAVSASYLGLNTTSDSNDGGIFGGLFAALAYEHPTWNAFDLKAVFRITASNWSTGYAPANWGYGIVNWNSAENYSGSIYLQPPGLLVNNFGYYATLTLYPFRQTRRSYEVICTYNSSYSQSGGTNELNSTQFASACATQIYPSATWPQQSVVAPEITYAPLTSGTVTFVAFTTDGMGNYSRLEEFSTPAATFVVGNACINPGSAPGNEIMDSTTPTPQALTDSFGQTLTDSF